MKYAILFVSSFIYVFAIAQPSDFIVLKKVQHTIKNFFSGSMIGVVTQNGSFSGKITSVKKDSLFIEMYDIRQVPTNLGVYMLDTVATYRLGFNYKDVIKIEREQKKGFSWAASGGSLLGGGVLITAVGLGTWIFAKPATRYHASPALVASGAALAGIGYLLLRSNNPYFTMGKKYHLEYIKVK